MMFAESSFAHANWLIAGGFFSALGFGTWKLIPAIGRRIKKELREALREEIANTIHPEIKSVNDRIDSHMGIEEKSLEATTQAIVSINESLEKNNDKLNSNSQIMNDHISNESTTVESMQDDLSAMKKQLNDRTPMFDRLETALDDNRTTLNQTNDVLKEHMHKDEVQFSQASEALAKGQKELLERLTEIATKKKR